MANTLLEEYRQQVPADKRGDDELNQILGAWHEQDNRYADYPDFIQDYQALKVRKESAQVIPPPVEDATSAAGAFGVNTGMAVVPAGGAAAGFWAGAEMGAPAAPATYGLAPIVTGLIGAIVGAVLADKGQRAALKEFAPDIHKELEEYQSLAEQEHPVAAAAGRLAGNIPVFEANPLQAVKGVAAVIKMARGKAVTKAEKKSAAAFAVQTGLATGTGVVTPLVQGEMPTAQGMAENLVDALIFGNPRLKALHPNLGATKPEGGSQKPPPPKATQIAPLDPTLKKLHFDDYTDEHTGYLESLFMAQRDGTLTPEQEHTIRNLPPRDVQYMATLAGRTKDLPLGATKTATPPAATAAATTAAASFHYANQESRGWWEKKDKLDAEQAALEPGTPEYGAKRKERQAHDDLAYTEEGRKAGLSKRRIDSNNPLEIVNATASIVDTLGQMNLTGWKFTGQTGVENGRTWRRVESPDGKDARVVWDETLHPLERAQLEKNSDPAKAASVPLMVTKEMNQALADLGYTEQDRASLRPEEAQSIIEVGLKNPKARAAAAKVDAAAAKTNTNPTEAQKESGKYKKGQADVQGITIDIENPKGSVRSGTGPDGKPWSVEMPAHYGEIPGVKGADQTPGGKKDWHDVYIGPNPLAEKVFVVDQIDPKTGKFDEHKSMLGFNSQAEALAAYDAAFSDSSGPKRRGAVTELPMAQFKDWLKNGQTQQPMAAASRSKAVEAVAEPEKKAPPLPSKDIAITVQRPDGTTYEAGFNQHMPTKMEKGPDGEPIYSGFRPVLSVLKDGSWSTGSPLPEGHVIIKGKIPDAPPEPKPASTKVDDSAKPTQTITGSNAEKAAEMPVQPKAGVAPAPASVETPVAELEKLAGKPAKPDVVVETKAPKKPLAAKSKWAEKIEEGRAEIARLKAELEANHDGPEEPDFQFGGDESGFILSPARAVGILARDIPILSKMALRAIEMGAYKFSDFAENMVEQWAREFGDKKKFNVIPKLHALYEGLRDHFTATGDMAKLKEMTPGVRYYTEGPNKGKLVRDSAEAMANESFIAERKLMGKTVTDKGKVLEPAKIYPAEHQLLPTDISVSDRATTVKSSRGRKDDAIARAAYDKVRSKHNSDVEHSIAALVSERDRVQAKLDVVAERLADNQGRGKQGKADTAEQAQLKEQLKNVALRLSEQRNTKLMPPWDALAVPLHAKEYVKDAEGNNVLRAKEGRAKYDHSAQETFIDSQPDPDFPNDKTRTLRNKINDAREVVEPAFFEPKDQSLESLSVRLTSDSSPPTKVNGKAPSNLMTYRLAAVYDKLNKTVHLVSAYVNNGQTNLTKFNDELGGKSSDTGTALKNVLDAKLPDGRNRYTVIGSFRTKELSYNFRQTFNNRKAYDRFKDDVRRAQNDVRGTAGLSEAKMVALKAETNSTLRPSAEVDADQIELHRDTEEKKPQSDAGGTVGITHEEQKLGQAEIPENQDTTEGTIHEADSAGLPEGSGSINLAPHEIETLHELLRAPDLKPDKDGRLDVADIADYILNGEPSEQLKAVLRKIGDPESGSPIFFSRIEEVGLTKALNEYGYKTDPATGKQLESRTAARPKTDLPHDQRGSVPGAGDPATAVAGQQDRAQPVPPVRQPEGGPATGAGEGQPGDAGTVKFNLPQQEHPLISKLRALAQADIKKFNYLDRSDSKTLNSLDAGEVLSWMRSKGYNPDAILDSLAKEWPPVGEPNPPRDWLNPNPGETMGAYLKRIHISQVDGGIDAFNQSKQTLDDNTGVLKRELPDPSDTMLKEAGIGYKDDAPYLKFNRPDSDNGGPVNPEHAALLDSIHAAAERAGIKVEAVKGALGAGAYDPKNRTLLQVVGHVVGAQDVKTALHEVGHDVFANETTEVRSRIVSAIDKLSDSDLGVDLSADSRIRSSDPAGLGKAAVNEERLVDATAQRLLDEGFNPDEAKGFAQKFVRTLKDYYYRAVDAVQKMMGYDANPEMARRYFENRVKRLLAGDNTPHSYLDFIGARKLTPEEAYHRDYQTANHPLGERLGPDGQLEYDHQPELSMEAARFNQENGVRYNKAPQTSYPSFKKWFGGSKVTKTGKPGDEPLVVYHGTKNEFTVLDPKVLDPNALFGPGFYMTESREVAAGDKGYAYKGAFKSSETLEDEVLYNKDKTLGENIAKWKKDRRDSETKYIQSIKASEQFKSEMLSQLQEDIDSYNFITSKDGKMLEVHSDMDGNPHAMPLYAKIDRPFDMDNSMFDHPIVERWNKMDKVPPNDPGFAMAAADMKRSENQKLISDELKQGDRRFRLMDEMKASIPPLLQKLSESGAAWQARKLLDKWSNYVDGMFTFDNRDRMMLNDISWREFYQDQLTDIYTKPEITKALQALGYDGITHTGGLGRGGVNPHKVWIAFDPVKIKSAIGNRGTFDPSNPDIRYNLPSQPPNLSGTVLHRVRDEQDIPAILRDGLRRGTNVSMEGGKANQSLGDGVTLVYDKADVSASGKGYNPNDGLVDTQRKARPKAVLIHDDGLPVRSAAKESDVVDQLNEAYLQEKAREDRIDAKNKAAQADYEAKLSAIKVERTGDTIIVSVPGQSEQVKGAYNPLTGESKTITRQTPGHKMEFQLSTVDGRTLLKSQGSNYYRQSTQPEVAARDIFAKEMLGLQEPTKLRTSLVSNSKIQELEFLLDEMHAKGTDSLPAKTVSGYVESLGIPKDIPAYTYEVDENGNPTNFKRVDRGSDVKYNLPSSPDAARDPAYDRELSVSGYNHQLEVYGKAGEVLKADPKLAEHIAGLKSKGVTLTPEKFIRRLLRITADPDRLKRELAAKPAPGGKEPVNFDLAKTIDGFKGKAAQGQAALTAQRNVDGLVSRTGNTISRKQGELRQFEKALVRREKALERAQEDYQDAKDAKNDAANNPKLDALIAVKKDRWEQAKRRVTRGKTSIAKVNTEIDALNKILPGFQAEQARLNARLGIGVEFTFRHDAPYVVVADPNATSAEILGRAKGKATVAKLKLDATSRMTDPKELEAQLRKNVEFLRTREAKARLGDEDALDSVYRSVKNATDALSAQKYTVDVATAERTRLGLVVSPEGQKLADGIGTMQARAFKAMITLHNNVMEAFHRHVKTDGRKTLNSEDALLNLAPTLSRDTLRRDILSVAMHTMQHANDLGEKFSDPNLRDRAIFQRVKDDLLENGDTAAHIGANKDQFFAALWKHLNHTADVSAFQEQQARSGGGLKSQLGLNVLDPKIKAVNPATGTTEVAARAALPIGPGKWTWRQRFSDSAHAALTALNRSHWAALDTFFGEGEGFKTIAERYQEDPAKLAEDLMPFTNDPDHHQTVRADFFEPLAQMQDKSPFLTPESGELARAQADASLVRDAFEQSEFMDNGDMVKFAEKLYELHEGKGDMGTYVEETVKTFNNIYKELSNKLAEHDGTPASQHVGIRGMIHNAFIDARTVDHLPGEWFDYHSYDPKDLFNTAQSIAGQTAFGRGGEKLAQSVESMGREVKEARDKIEGVVRDVTRANPNATAREIKAALTARFGKELTTLQQQAKGGKLIKSAVRGLSDYFRKDNSPDGSVRVGVRMLGTLGNLMVQQGTSAIRQLEQLDAIFLKYGVSKETGQAFAQMLKTTGNETIHSLAQAVGLVMRDNSETHRMYVENNLHDPDLIVKWKGLTDPLEGESTASRAFRVLNSALGMTANLHGEKDTHTGLRLMQPFTTMSMMVDKGLTGGVWNMATRFAGYGHQYYKAHPEHLNAQDFRLDSDTLGLKGASRNTFNRFVADMQNHGIDYDAMVRNGLRRGDGTALSPEEVKALYGLSVSVLSSESNLTTMPTAAYNNTMFQMISPLLGWPFRRMMDVMSVGRTPEGRHSLGQFAHGLAGLGVMALGGLAVSALANQYQEDLLGKKSNLRPIVGAGGPEEQMLSVFENLNRAGTFGFLGELANLGVNTGLGGDNRSIADANSRVLALSYINGVGKAISSFINQDKTADYTHVVRPLISSFGGGGLLQYMQLANKALDLDNVESRTTARLNAKNYLQVVGRQLGMEVRSRGGGNYTPNAMSPYLTRMELAAYGGNAADFQQAFREAVAQAKKDGEADPMDHVKRAYAGRNPLKSVFAAALSAADYKRILATLPEDGRRDVTEAVDTFNQFAERIGARTFEGSQPKKTATRSLRPVGMRSRALEALYN